MVYSLGSSTLPNITWGTYYNDMGSIQEEGVTKTADLDVQPPLYTDSDETDAFDNGGSVRRINAKFTKIVDSWSDAATFSQALFTLINGDQSPPEYPLNYVSDILGTIKVKIESIDVTNVHREGPCVVTYSLKLVECSELG